MSNPCQKEEIIAIIREDLKEIKVDVKKLLSSVAILSVKAGIWGIGGGAIVVALWFLKKG
jgi:hypothetical protein